MQLWMVQITGLTGQNASPLLKQSNVALWIKVHLLGEGCLRIKLLIGVHSLLPDQTVRFSLITLVLPKAPHPSRPPLPAHGFLLLLFTDESFCCSLWASHSFAFLTIDLHILHILPEFSRSLHGFNSCLYAADFLIYSSSPDPGCAPQHIASCLVNISITNVSPGRLLL